MGVSTKPIVIPRSAKMADVKYRDGMIIERAMINAERMRPADTISLPPRASYTLPASGCAIMLKIDIVPNVRPIMVGVAVKVLYRYTGI